VKWYLVKKPLSIAGASGCRRPEAGGELEYDRILFFSDAVFAIAITLLIVDLRVPDVAHLESGRQLRHSIPQIGGFAYSFAAIGLFWLAHHGLFRHIKALDRSRSQWRWSSRTWPGGCGC
jgi:uncharacterized membrane protein